MRPSLLLHQVTVARTFQILLLSATALVATPSVSALAQVPAGIAGGQVTGGSANIVAGDKLVDVHQQTNRAVIDWRTLDVARGETLQFHQPSVNSVVLNRVNDVKASEIRGSLKANGNVMILNSSTALSTTCTARWLAYSDDRASGVQLDSLLADFNRYGCTYAGGCASGISIPAAGDSLIFTARPTVTIQVNIADKIYDGITDATLDSVSLLDVLSGDSLTVDSSASSVAFTTKQAGTTKQTTASGFAINETEIGYLLTIDARSAEISKRPLTIANFTADNKSFDSTNQATISQYSFDDAVTGDQLDINGLLGAFATPDVGDNKIVTLTAGTLSGADAANYDFTLGTATALANITEAPAPTPPSITPPIIIPPVVSPPLPDRPPVTPSMPTGMFVIPPTVLQISQTGGAGFSAYHILLPWYDEDSVEQLWRIHPDLVAELNQTRAPFSE